MAGAGPGYYTTLTGIRRFFRDRWREGGKGAGASWGGCRLRRYDRRDGLAVLSGRLAWTGSARPAMECAI